MSELISMIRTGNLTGDYVENVVFLTENMEVVFSARPLNTGLSETDGEWIKKAAFGSLISDTMEGAYEDGEYFIAAVPVFEDRMLLGYIASKISCRVFSVTQGNLTNNSDTGFILFDSAGNSVKLSTGEASEYTYRDLTADDGSEISHRKYFISESKIYLNGSDSAWRVFYLLSGESMYGVFNTLAASLFGACVFMIFIGIGALFTYRKYFLKPANMISEALGDMNKSKNYLPIAVKTGQKHFDTITDGINKMIEYTVNGDTAINVVAKKYSALFREKRIVFIKWDIVNSVFEVSPFYREIFGREFVSYVGREFTPELMNIHPEDAEKYTQWIKDIRLGRKARPLVYRRKIAGGKYKYFEHTFVINSDEMGNPVEALGFITDVDRFERKEIALKRAAELDRYTGAYNKYSYMEILKKKYEEAMAGGEGFCVSLIKLHNFYELEDKRLGAGEEGLRFIVNVLSENIDCSVGRVLSDAIGAIGSPKNVSFFADEIAKELDLGFTFSETEEHFDVKTTAALFFTDDEKDGFEEFIKKCCREYERFAQGPENDYFFNKQ